MRTRVPQLILAAVAAYECRSLLSSVSRFITMIAGAHSLVQLGWLMLVVLGLGLGSWQVGRGLDRVAEVPRWTMRLVSLWLMLCSALLVLFSAAGTFTGHCLLNHLLGAGRLWADGPAVLASALVLAVSFEGTRWFSRRPISIALPRAYTGLSTLGRRRRPASDPDAALVPLLDGWSDRGPPSRLTSQAI